MESRLSSHSMCASGSNSIKSYLFKHMQARRAWSMRHQCNCCKIRRYSMVKSFSTWVALLLWHFGGSSSHGFSLGLTLFPLCSFPQTVHAPGSPNLLGSPLPLWLPTHSFTHCSLSGTLPGLPTLLWKCGWKSFRPHNSNVDFVFIVDLKSTRVYLRLLSKICEFSYSKFICLWNFYLVMLISILNAYCS